MSEYVTIETRPTADPDVLDILTNQTLTEAVETYANFDAGDQGSPIAQMLFNGVDGLAALTITHDTLTITRQPEVPWEAIVDEMRDALRDFFL
ncbi:MAG TPA: NifU N-terminal domain-containing protein [Phototrophicaceae bacterium]|nr:NifU N-terminal domain-containing protein [Phototrophicaceae bacterium]